jgi:hypothetical protein
MYDATVRAIALTKLEAGATVSEVSRELRISRAAIRSWIGVPNDVGGCPAPFSSSSAYAALFGFYLGDYLGDGCISRHPRTYSMRVACDSSLPGIVADVESTLALVHPERRTYRVPAPGVIVVQQYWNHWPCLFPQHGPGRKHERQLVMTEWQQAIVEDHPSSFLRGLFHSDGCLVNNWATRVVSGEKKRYEYRRWQFVNESSDIMRWCGESLDRVGVAWRQTNRRTLSVSRRADVACLTELIGTKS